MKDGVLYRHVYVVYKEHYEALINSGLYAALQEEKLMVPHDEVLLESAPHRDVFKTLKPEEVPFISYPYEWCFSQLRDAAFATLAIQKRALEFGMILKDASAYNIQFTDGRPVLIDTLSFEIYEAGSPWIAYRQFCEHFLAPLALMRYRDVRLSHLLKNHIDGIPLDLASALLPRSTYFKSSILTHIHLHAKMQSRYADRPKRPRAIKIRESALRGIIDSLESAVYGLAPRPQKTQWSGYRSVSYSDRALQHKQELVGAFLDMLRPKVVWDMGGNVGTFSRIAGDKGAYTISFDSDAQSVEEHYGACKRDRIRNILPLCMDIANPSPAIGWENQERVSLGERGPADTALALALVHHLALSHNVPLERIAHFFSRVCGSLIIEFVPKVDPWAAKLLAGREDIFFHYTQQDFESAFRTYFVVLRAEKVEDSERVLYCMQKK